VISIVLVIGVGCNTCLLLGHELDEVSVVSSQAGCGEFLHAESSENVVEEIQLNPFLESVSYFSLDRNNRDIDMKE
jgi:hypothetical protein